MQQAARVSDYTAFFTVGNDGAGYLVEIGATAAIFTNPRERLTDDYISGASDERPGSQAGRRG